jgi:hypothetical protein
MPPNVSQGRVNPRSGRGRPRSKDAFDDQASAYPKGWNYRGYLPHFGADTVIRLITFRLADSLPKAIFKCSARFERRGPSTKELHKTALFDHFVLKSYGAILASTKGHFTTRTPSFRQMIGNDERVPSERKGAQPS